MKNELNERLKNLRKTAGVSQTELAERLNVHPQTVSKWERGVSEPDIAQMSELAAAFGVSLEKLFGADEGEQTFSGSFSAERLGEYISALRTGQNESQQQLAEICSSSADAVSRWERGVTCPDVAELRTLAGHFNIPVSKLYYAVSDEVAVPTVVTGRKNRRTVAVLSGALALTTAAAAVFLALFLLNRPREEVTVPLTVTVDGVAQAVDKNDWFTPQAANKTGYDFLGWRDAEGNDVAVPYKVTADCEFVAVYAPHEYHIEYWLNGGTFANAEAQTTFTVESGEVDLPSLQKQGATFEGWYFANDYGGNAVTSVLCNAQDIKLYAKWSDETYTVRYELGGGTLYENNPEYVTQSNEITLCAPLRKGYLFLGWYDEKEGGNRVEVVGGANAKNFTLYAQWQKSDAVFTVNYELNGGEQGAGNPATIKAGDMFTLSAPEKRGHDFLGWNAKPDGTGEYITKVYGSGENIFLYAVFVPKEYMLRYVYEGVYLTDEVNPNYVTFGQSVTLIPVYRYGYDFLGWYDSESGGSLVTVIDEENLPTLTTLYARFAIKTYAVSLNGDGGTFVTPEGERGTYCYMLPFDGSLILPEAFREGYDFLGWENEAGERVEKLNIQNIAEMSLTASWREKNKTYNITFETNGGTLENGNVAQMLCGETVALPVPERDGYLFLGWNDKADESGAYHDLAESEWQEDLMLYAVWQEIKTNGSSEFFEYTKGAESVTITKYLGDYGENVRVNIPAVIEGLPVTEVNFYFSGGGYDRIYRSITVPEGVTKLGDSLFAGIILLEPLIIPASVMQVGLRCFKNITAEIYFKEGCCLEEVSISAFEGAVISNVVVLPQAVKRIKSEAFYNARVSGVILPEGLTAIERQGMNFKDGNVYVPSTVTYAGYNACKNAYISLSEEQVAERTFDGAWAWTMSGGAVYNHTAHKVILRDGEWEQEYINKYVQLPKREKQGYRFLGWQNEAGEFVNHVFIPETDCTLNATYEEITLNSGLTRATPLHVQPNGSFMLTSYVNDTFYFIIDTEEDCSCSLQVEASPSVTPAVGEISSPDYSIYFNVTFSYQIGIILALKVYPAPSPVTLTIRVTQL